MSLTWGDFFGFVAGIYSVLCIMVLMMMIPVFDCGYQLTYYACPIYSPSNPIVAWSLFPGVLIGFIYMYIQTSYRFKKEKQ